MRYKPIDPLGPRPNPQGYLIEQRRAILSDIRLIKKTVNRECETADKYR